MDELSKLIARVEELERKSISLDTQIDATEQALAAMSLTQKNKEKIKDLDARLNIAVRGVNAIACILTGAVLLWFGNPLINDVSATNDEIGKGLFIGGGGIIAYGILVLTGNESRVLSTLETINPWKR